MNIRNTNVKNSKGITLISLIITIIVLIILASISVYSGLSSIKSSRFIEFRSELEMMQTQVDYLNEEYTRLEKNGEDGEDGEAYIQSKGKDLTYSAEEQESFEGVGISDKTNYRYFDKTSIEDLGLSGLKYEFLLSIKDRKVIAIGGLKYNGIIYYTIDQIREVLELEPLERGPVTVDNIDFNPIEGTRCKIVVTNIKCSKYVAKYTIQYRNVDLGDTFSTLGKLITDKDFSFEVDTEGTYEILITDAAGQTLLKTISVRRYTIKYDANGGEGAPVQQIKIHNKDLTLQTGKPTREGYNFLGWSETKNSTTVQYQPGDTYTKNADTTLYAVWKIKTYTITYNLGNGSGSIPSQTKTHGINITLSTTRPTPNDSAYEFKGWSESSGGSVQYQPGGTFTKNANTTLYAIYQLKTYTITYNANGGSGAPGNQTKTHGVNLKLSSTKPTRSGYTFQGWSESAGGSVQYQPGGTFTKNENKTLYAIWKRNTWTVTFHANGGRFSNGSETYSVEVNQGDSITLPAVTTFPNGFRTNHLDNKTVWSTYVPNRGVPYTSGQSYKPTKNITLYAAWYQSLEGQIVPAYSTHFESTSQTIYAGGKTVRIEPSFNMATSASGTVHEEVQGSNDGYNWVTLASWDYSDNKMPDDNRNYSGYNYYRMHSVFNGNWGFNNIAKLSSAAIFM